MENHPHRKDERQGAAMETSRQDEEDRKRKRRASSWLTPHRKNGKRVPWLKVDTIFISSSMAWRRNKRIWILSQMLLGVFVTSRRLVWALVDFSAGLYMTWAAPSAPRLHLPEIYLSLSRSSFCSQAVNSENILASSVTCFFFFNQGQQQERWSIHLQPDC